MSTETRQWTAIAALVLFAVAACSEPAPPRIFPAATTPVALVPGRYELIPDLCSVFDRSAVQAILPYAERFESESTDFSMECGTRMGVDRDSAGTFELRVEVDADPRVTLFKFEGTRSAQRSYATIEPLDGIGQGAYQYIDPVLGPHAVAYDGNAYFDIRWGTLGRSEPLPPGLREAMVASLKATMANLRVGEAPRSP